MLDGVNTPCSFVTSYLANGIAALCPSGGCVQYGTYAYRDGSTSRGFAVFRAFADNRAGLIPNGAHYIGGGEYAFGRPKGLPVDNSTDLTFGRRRRIREEAAPGGIPAVEPQDTGRVPLSGEALADYLATRDNLVKLLKDKESECAKYLSKTVGISGSRIARTVLAQRPFDGDASTVSLEDAGIVPRGGPIDIGGGYALPSTAQVRDFFGVRPRIAFAAQAGYARASTGATFHDVYYVPIPVFSESTILEEALHTFLGSQGSDAEIESRKVDSTDLQSAGCNSTGRAYDKK